ncbi:MAG: hydrogenase nickel incorporation protein HypB [Leptospiraceae bacterium]|nr:hydrogenase nickel incorporation protein HypB [Leptospiraceae bacterium]MCP5500300.1 hydrogenase nickel incorporation protein HypB [Leptospiraceae bacterium]
MEIQVVQHVLEKNKKLADEVRKILNRDKQYMVNFMSSPGAGKTLVLEKLIPYLLAKGISVGVIEGDVATLNDSKRLQPLQIPIVQINTEQTGGLCHLGSNTVLAAMEELNNSSLQLILVENVGNLVCPGESDIGSDLNIVITSPTEGEDKPLKYPRIFLKSDLVLINKVDIAEIIGSNLSLLKENIYRVKPGQNVLEISAKTGIGIEELAVRIIKLMGEKIYG